MKCKLNDDKTPGRSNQFSFQRYRMYRSSAGQIPYVHKADSNSRFFLALLMGDWNLRYGQRAAAIRGYRDGDRPLADVLARDILMARQRLRNTCPVSSEWTPEQVEIGEQALARGSEGVSSFADPPAYGPSIVALWHEARRKGIPVTGIARYIWEWSNYRPPAWERDDEREAKRLPAIDQVVTQRLEQRAVWAPTGDLDYPWATEVAGERWQVRLNDFPDDYMYTLVVNGSAVGDFHDWPEAWDRGAANADRPEQEEAQAAPPPPIRTRTVDASGLLARYRGGEHEAVWEDLAYLGPAVRKAPYRDEAWAVAQETMRRVRHNVEALIDRLRKIGYEFFDWRAQVGRRTQSAAELKTAFRQMLAESGAADTLPDPESMIAATVQGIAEARERLERQLGSGQQRMLGPSEEHAPLLPFTADDKRFVAGAEKHKLWIPLSLKAWLNEIGYVDFCGSHPALCFMDDQNEEPGAYADPLQVQPWVKPLENWYEDWLESPKEQRRPVIWDLSFDDEGKAGLAIDRQVESSYSVSLPNPSADAPFEGERHRTTFVNYLRVAFQWGGFPGWERYEQRPEKELAYLREGLLPF